MEANTAPLELAPHPLEGDHDCKIWWIVGPNGNSTIIDYTEVRAEGHAAEGPPASYIDWVLAHGTPAIQDLCDTAATFMAPGIYLWEGVARWSRTSRAEFLGVFTYQTSLACLWDALCTRMPTPCTIISAS